MGVWPPGATVTLVYRVSPMDRRPQGVWGELAHLLSNTRENRLRKQHARCWGDMRKH